MTIVAFAVDLANNLEFVTFFCIVCRICDKRVSSIHITLLAVLNNFGEFVHKFYLFRLVDAFGIFIPQVGALIFLSVFVIMYSKKFCELDDLPVTDFHVGDEAISSPVLRAESGKKPKKSAVKPRVLKKTPVPILQEVPEQV